MFSKKSEKLESFIGPNSKFKGSIFTQGTLRVDGVLEGNVEADWLVIGDKGAVKGNVEAKSVIIGGTLEGNATAKEIIEIKQKGLLRGDIVTAKLNVAEGGIFDGRSMMQSPKEEIKAIEFVKEPNAKVTNVKESKKS